MAAILIVLASIVLGFSVVGSPATQRAIRMDNQRLMDLQSIQWQVVNYYQSKEGLPGSLSDIEDSISGFEIPKDPETNLPYEYVLIGQSAKTFQLCATFTRESQGEGSMMGRDYSYAMPMDPMMGGEKWNHPAGRHCFDRTIDPDFYPVRKPL